MQYRKLAHKMKAQIVNFSGILSKGLPKVAQRFTAEMIYGIQVRQSVRISEISRSLNEPIALKKTEERLCRQLRRPGLRSHFLHRVLTEAAPRVTDDTLVILDLSDIAKKYAEKMEYMAGVHDGSDNTVGNGYWILQAIGARVGASGITPLYSHLYSQDAPDFKSENDEILTAVDQISVHTGNRGIYVLDRAGDRKVLIGGFLERGKRFIIRMVGNRDLIFDGVPINTRVLADVVPLLYTDRVVRKNGVRESAYTVQLGYTPVTLPGHADQLYLVVIRGFGEEPMMLLTNKKITGDKKSLQWVMKAYIRRWRVEDTLRFMKQSYNLEDIRILTYHRLQNIMLLVLAVMYFACVWLENILKLHVLTSHTLKAAKRLFGIPDFLYYAIADGIRELMAGFKGRIIDSFSLNNDSNQLWLFEP
jgi:hypothetical protein